MAEQKKATVRRPYGRYDQRTVPAEDAELTHVGPGTPGGEYLRRFWHPLVMSSELKDLPKAVRMLGEDLVLFRDKSGRSACSTGIAAIAAPRSNSASSRSAASAAAITAGCSISTARILETPGEPASSNIKDRISRAPIRRANSPASSSPIWARRRRSRNSPTTTRSTCPTDKMVPYSLTYPCNWLQIIENVMDPAHGVFLHTRISFEQFSPAWGEMPVTEFRGIAAGHDLHHDAPGRRSCMGADERHHPAEPGASRRDLGSGHEGEGFHPDEPDALDGADR